jgi:hypothetical protein
LADAGVFLAWRCLGCALWATGAVVVVLAGIDVDDDVDGAAIAAVGTSRAVARARANRVFMTISFERVRSGDCSGRAASTVLRFAG